MHTTLIRTEQLGKLREEAADLIVIDCSFDLFSPESGHASYLERHVPGATYMHLDHDLSGPRTGSNGRHPLPDRATFVALLRKRGVNLASQVVAYDAQEGIYAARLWWMLRWVGHVAVAVLEGGLQAWQRQGLPTEAGVQTVRSEGDLQLHPSLVQTVDTADVLANLQTRARVVIDARSPDRYRGENEIIDPRAGHIPGALNRSFKNNLNPDGDFKSAAELRTEFVGLLRGVPPKNAIQQCGSGVSACHNLLAMEVAGLPGSALYPGSWSEWSADPSRPIATDAAL